MMQTQYLQGIMKKNAENSYEKTNPNKANFGPILRVLICRKGKTNAFAWVWSVE